MTAIHDDRGAVILNVDGDGLERAYLGKAMLRRAQLAGQSLAGATLSCADLREANLEGCNLTDTRLDDADLTGANLQGAVFRGCDLTRACLKGANLSGSDLRGATLDRTNFEGVNLSLANLEGCQFSNDFRCVNFRGANLRQAFLHADFKLGEFSGADLTGARILGNLASCQLAATDLSPVKQFSFNSRERRMSDTLFWDATTIWPPGMKGLLLVWHLSPWSAYTFPGLGLMMANSLIVFSSGLSKFAGLFWASVLTVVVLILWTKLLRWTGP